MNSTRRSFIATWGGALAATKLGRAAEIDIFEAAATGNTDRVKELTAAKPEIVNQRAGNGRTPLYFAAEAGQAQMVTLLAVGMFEAADLSAGSESPLIAIANYKDPAIAMDMALPLLSNGSNPNVKRKDGATALHIAAARGNVDVARLLIHRGAHLSPDDKVVSERINDADRIERVYFGKRLAREGANGLPQVKVNEFIALSHVEVERVKQMHKQNRALLLTRATWDESPIEAAAHMGLDGLALYFADAGAAVSTCSAVMLGLTDMVRKTVREDPDVIRERGAHDFPLLSYTVFGPERAEIAEVLLEAGARPNAFGFGMSPLHIAASQGYLEAAALLLDHGADVNAVPRSRKGPGPTPLGIAMQKKQEKMAELLKSRGGRA